MSLPTPPDSTFVEAQRQSALSALTQAQHALRCGQIETARTRLLRIGECLDAMAQVAAVCAAVAAPAAFPQMAFFPVPDCCTPAPAPETPQQPTPEVSSP